jgi:hypothetical protein
LVTLSVIIAIGVSLMAHELFTMVEGWQERQDGVA